MKHYFSVQLSCQTEVLSRHKVCNWRDEYQVQTYLRGTRAQFVCNMPTTIKQALKKWEETTGKKAGEATEVKLIGVYPPIEKVWYSSTNLPDDSDISVQDGLCSQQFVILRKVESFYKHDHQRTEFAESQISQNFIIRTKPYQEFSW